MNDDAKQLLIDAMDAVALEVTRAQAAYPPFHTAHEGYSVLLEEVDELWAHVKVRQGKRDTAAMRKEAIQVAAMAVRFALDLDGDRGQR